MKIQMTKLSQKESPNPLKCALEDKTANVVRIFAASASAQPPTASNLTTALAGSCQNFTVPLDTTGNRAVVAEADMIPAPPSPVLQTGNNLTESDGSVLATGTFIDVFATRRRLLLFSLWR
jgi:hypothetical protein